LKSEKQEREGVFVRRMDGRVLSYLSAATVPPVDSR
jgi:hypothetical protein